MGQAYCNRRSFAFGAGLAWLLASGYTTNTAQAQSTFCPNITAVTNEGTLPTNLQSGLCTNAQNGEGLGALSTAALSSQALSEISQSSIQLSNTATTEAIAERRKEEAERCPDGFERVNGTCRKIASAPPTPTPQHHPKQNKTLRGEVPVTPSAPMTYKAEPSYKAVPVIVDTGIHPAIWAHGFGDHQTQTGAFVAPGPAGAGEAAIASPGQPPTPMLVNIDSKTTIWGFVSGADLTLRNIAIGGDVLIAGVLGGYLASDMNLDATSTSTNTTAALGGSSTTHIHLSGPSAGAYATYFSGPFSTDLTFKTDFLRINEGSFEVFNFLNGQGETPSTFTVPFSGTGSGNVDDLSVIGNVNYRFPIYPWMWIEPTAGFNYTYSLYDAAAASLGLSDGYVLLLQGGARLGFDFFWGGVHVTPTITGLAYDDVKIVGGPILNGAFVGGPLLTSDEGKIRGEEIFAMNFDYGNGFLSFAQAIVYGGEDLIGVGGKVGIRYQW
jgi:hypothetical protein